MDRYYKHLAICGLISFGSLALILLLQTIPLISNIMTAIFFAGSVGAVINNYYRLARLYDSGAIAHISQPRVIVTQFYVSLLFSGILGFIAYGLFASSLLQGGLFPKFKHMEHPYVSLQLLLAMASPATNLDAAKAIIWAFIAGFSERFVPNAIDALTKAAPSSEQAPPK
ncbi:hypothetical protein ACTG15_07585 [Aeromonas sp. 164P]